MEETKPTGLSIALSWTYGDFAPVFGEVSLLRAFSLLPIVPKSFVFSRCSSCDAGASRKIDKGT